MGDQVGKAHIKYPLLEKGMNFTTNIITYLWHVGSTEHLGNDRHPLHPLVAIRNMTMTVHHSPRANS